MGSKPDSRSDTGPSIADMVRRIWGRDYSLWPDPSPGSDGDWLGWLDLPESLNSGIGLAGSGQRETITEFRSFNVLGMGGSSLTPEVLRTIFSDADINLNVFDTVNPISISEALDSLDLSTAVFGVASKSGTTLEPLSLESIFRSAMDECGVDNVSEHFVALTDHGTPLANRAADGEFSVHVSTPENVGGRFSALSGFGMFPASICGMPTDEMADSALAMASECRREDIGNPGIELGLFMAKNALRGRDKVTLVLSPSLERFGLWLEQLLAESTGKNGRGLIPVAGEPVLPRRLYGDDRQFVCIALAGEDVAENPAYGDHPTIRIEITDLPSVAGEFFRWEFATSVAASGIGVYPFDQPNVESAKQLAREALETDARSKWDTASLADAADGVIEGSREGDYVAIAAYLPESDRLTDAVSELRKAISGRTNAATTFGYGPRYLHSTGQLHKGGPNSVQLLAITQRSEVDVEVPGQSYTLGDLLVSQAVGDVRACRESGRRSSLVEIEGDTVGQIEAVADRIGQS